MIVCEFNAYGEILAIFFCTIELSPLSTLVPLHDTQKHKIFSLNCFAFSSYVIFRIEHSFIDNLNINELIGFLTCDKVYIKIASKLNSQFE